MQVPASRYRLLDGGILDNDYREDQVSGRQPGAVYRLRGQLATNASILAADSGGDEAYHRAQHRQRNQREQVFQGVLEGLAELGVASFEVRVNQVDGHCGVEVGYHISDERNYRAGDPEDQPPFAFLTP